jgi:DMSO/TMAO reductase YedYZ molybdopterin-dependent catalytic subunit
MQLRRASLPPCPPLLVSTLLICARDLMSTTTPFPDPPGRGHTNGDFFREEVRLANRNHGILLETLRHDVTPAGMHYLLTHFDVPYVPDASNWLLSFGGLVKNRFQISLAEIKRLPARTLRVTLECAGNGRANLTPRWPSMPWGECAVGTAEWTGTPLKPLLERAGLLDNCRDIVFSGIDRGFDKVEHTYERALKPALAADADVLLVYAMNGQELLPQHGFPLRLIVPGWYGMASVKWLNTIEAIDHAFQGQQQVGTYVYKQARGEPGLPVTTIRVKSLMVPPGIPDWYSRRRVVEAGAVTVHGRAWSGAGVPIVKVEFACNGVWQPAELGPVPPSPYAWRGWSTTWSATPGHQTLACRSTDANGATQPLEQRWDFAGFGNNHVHQVEVTVR